MTFYSPFRLGCVCKWHPTSSYCRLISLWAKPLIAEHMMERYACFMFALLLALAVLADVVGERLQRLRVHHRKQLCRGVDRIRHLPTSSAIDLVISRTPPFDAE